MASDWSNLGDPGVFQGMPLPASPVTASGQDPDEMREQMAQRASQLQAARFGGSAAADSPFAQYLQANPVQPVQTVQPVSQGAPASAGPASAFEPAGANADVARQSMTGQLTAGQKLGATADAMQPDPEIARLEAKKLADEQAAPDPSNYRPGFGTRLLRGLKAAGLGAAEGGIFGAAAGALDPALVHGGTPYGAPTDAYDVALAKNKQAVGADTEQLGNAQASFKQAQDLRAAQEKGYQDSGEAFKGAGTTATSQEGEENKAAQIPIDQEKADAEKHKVFNESPDGKLQITQGQIDARTRLADQQRMPPGYMRTRYILTGEIQAAREPTAEEIAVNRIASAWSKDHGGQAPKTVEDWQKIYAAAKGGTGAGNAEDKNIREAASLAAKHLKDLQSVKSSKSYAIMEPADQENLNKQIQDAQKSYDDLSSRLLGAPVPVAPGAPAPISAAHPATPTGGQEGQFSPDGTKVMQGGKWINATGQDGKVRMKVPDPQHPGQTRFARFSPDKASQAAKMGASFAGAASQ